MWDSIVGRIVNAFLPFAVQTLQIYFERQAANTQAKRKWLSFVESMADTMGGSANLRKSWHAQAKRLKDQMDETKAPDLPPYRNREVLIKAAGEIGTKEIIGEGSNPRIEEYHRFATKDNDLGLVDDVPWCASFVCWVLEQAGMESPNSKLARSFEYWGRSSLTDPLPGDIVTFYRKGRESGLGHVGVLIKWDPQYVTILGGNQNDEVNLSLYSTSKMTGVRRSSKAGEYNELQREELLIMARNLLLENPVQPSNRVT